MYSLTWLADVLRAAGLTVVEQPGWQTRGRAEMGEVKGVILHHTGGALHGNAPSLALVEHGRLPPDPHPLPGPLSHLVLGRDGTFYVVAAGRCNHAGAGQWHGVTDGNEHMVGIEAENAGTGLDPWPQVEMDAYVRGVAAILEHVHADSVMASGHKEYALPRGRKVDPAFDMVAFRERLESRMALDAGRIASIPVTPIPATDPKRAMLRKGDQGNSVGVLQGLLGIVVDDRFGPATETAVKAFQSGHGLTPDGLVGPATWKALGQ